MIRSGGILALGLLLAAPPVHSDELSPVERLQQMSQALRERDYQGTFLYQSGARMDTLRLFHAGGSIEKERLLTLSGPRNEVLRDGTSITVLKADSSAFHWSSSDMARLLPLIPDAAQALPDAGYALRVAGTDRIAGYDAAIVDIVPQDSYRYGYRVWLEQASQLPLRVVMVGTDQRPLEQMMFVTLSVGTAPAATDLTLSSAPEQVLASVDEPASGGPQRWIIDNLPPGYGLTAWRGVVDAGQGRAVSEHLLYGDGLASVSVYAEPASGAIDEDVAMSRGAMNVYVHGSAGWRYTALGNVPAATVQWFATRMRPADLPPAGR